MDIQNNDGKTPLHGAAEDGNFNIVKLLISSGANVYILDNEGNTAFDLGKKHIEVASYLGHIMGEKFIMDEKYEDALKIYKELLTIQEVELGSDHSDTSRTRDFLYSVQTIMFDNGLSDEEPLVRYSWEKDINVQTHEGKTPLHIAAETGVLNNVKTFVALGANVNILDNDGKTAFDYGKKHVEVATYLGHTMGQRFQIEDKSEDALKIYKELLNIQEVELGSDHLDTIITRKLIYAVENLLNLQQGEREGHGL